MEFGIWVAYVSALSALIPVAFAVVGIRRLAVNSRLLTLLCLMSISADVISFVLMKAGKNTYPVINLFFVFHFLVLVQIFKASLEKIRSVGRAGRAPAHQTARKRARA